ncbi:MAG: hypothetical protein KF887_02195 [Paracoccaceae bacterium]|nr:MAG: hypothetical protein KF887_02195 [Paracoccaceae bacterium]
MASRKTPRTEADAAPDAPLPEPAHDPQTPEESPAPSDGPAAPPDPPSPDLPPRDPEPEPTLLVLTADPPPAEPEPATAKADPAPAPPRAEPVAPRRASPVLPFLGGVLAAGLGFAVAQVVPQGWPLAGTQALEARVAAQQSELERLAAAEAETRAALAALPPPAAGPDLAPLTARLDAIESRLGTLTVPPDPTARLEMIEGRIAVLETLPPPTGEPGDPAAMAALQRDLATLRAELASVAERQAQASADTAAAAEAVQAALREAEAEAAQLKAAAEETARAALSRAALGRVLAAIESGAAFAQPLDDLAGNGVEVPDALRAAATGVPTLATLQEDFADPARAALESALRADPGEGAVDRLATFLRSATGARSLTPRDGTDPDAILSRAEGHLREGRLSETLAELATLPEVAQPALAGWVARAQTRLNVQTAAAELAARVGE